MAASSFTRSLFSSNPSRYDSLLTGNPALMSAPTATDGGTGNTASVAFTTVASATSYGVLSSPGSFTATGTTSPLTVSGLSSGTAYTFQVRGINSTSTGPYSAASNSVTPVTPSSFESIATATGTGSSGTITFSSIPSTYKSLQIRLISKTTRTASFGTNDGFLQFNGDTGSNYSYHYLIGDGSAASAAGGATQTSMRIARIDQSSYTGLTNMMATAIIDIQDYASTTKNKTVRYISGNDTNAVGDGQINLGSGGWFSTSAVNQISIFVSGTSFTTTTQIALYGIKG
jgi:hypothetical protein